MATEKWHSAQWNSLSRRGCSLKAEIADGPGQRINVCLAGGLCFSPCPHTMVCTLPESTVIGIFSRNMQVLLIEPWALNLCTFVLKCSRPTCSGCSIGRYVREQLLGSRQNGIAMREDIVCNSPCEFGQHYASPKWWMQMSRPRSVLHRLVFG